MSQLFEEARDERFRQLGLLIAAILLYDFPYDPAQAEVRMGHLRQTVIPQIRDFAEEIAEALKA